GVTAGEETGWTVAAGDVGGDGIQDILISAVDANAAAGATYTVFGQKSWLRDTYTLDNNATTGLVDGTHGIRLNGANGQSGYSVAAGDLNGDGIPDIVLGAWQGCVTGCGSGPGEVDVYFGRKSGWTTPVALGGL